MKCSDCRRYRSKECQVNPSGKDLESAEYLTCFEPKEESGKTVVAEMGKTQATRRVRQKSTGKKILLVIAGIAVGIFVSTLGALLLKLTGLDGLLFFEALNGLATLAVTGFLIYYWVFRVEKGKLEKVPQEAKASKKRRKKTNKLLWEIPLLVVVIVAAVLVWQKPDWFRVSSHVSTSSPSVQHSDTKGSDTETIPLTQYFNGAKPIIEGHSIVVSETISAVDEAIEKLQAFSGIHKTTIEEMTRQLQASGAKKAAISEMEGSILKIDSEIVNFDSLMPPDKAMVYHKLVISSFKNDQLALENMLYYYTLAWEQGRRDSEVLDRANRHLEQARLERSEAEANQRFLLYQR